MFDGSNVTLVIAFVAGFITFFASCLLPLIPTYLAYLSGVSLSSINKAGPYRGKIFRSSLLFVLGFIFTFVILGATVNSLGRQLNPYRSWMQKAGGILFIILGLYLMGILKSFRLSQEYKLSLENWLKYRRGLYALLFGITFGFAWTPCIGPVLAVILFWSSQQATISQGILLLVAYGIGLGIPFLLIGFAFERMLPLLKKVGKVGFYLQVVSGVIILISGVLLLLGKFQIASLYLLHLFKLNYTAI